jgi:hypothetical protein
MIQTQLDYSDNDMARFKSDPANIDIITKAMDMAGITITAEVVESHGCFSGHRKGQKIHLDSAGNLLSKKCPDKNVRAAGRQSDSADIRPATIDV